MSDLPELETVPNFSEGRDRQVVDRLVGSFRNTPDVLFLDLHTDPDHNRSVVTAAGSVNGIREAIKKATEVALESINIYSHRGTHPYVGSVDVIPVVPLGDVSMDTATECARDIGQDLAEKFDLPIYLYGNAARREHTRDLYKFRKFRFDTLEENMQGEMWKPDYGPSVLHPAGGVTAVGSRGFLIAVNVDLETDTPSPANKIAERIRESNGGLPGVQALGMKLSEQNRIMVSMNLTDYHETSLYELIDRVHQEAERVDVKPGPTEIVGLIPEEALAGGEPADLHIPNFHPDRYVLERRIEIARQQR